MIRTLGKRFPGQAMSLLGPIGPSGRPGVALISALQERRLSYAACASLQATSAGSLSRE
jgi:hypothetical protein